jgi:nicotinate-nucleotide adenylyltransferase
MRDLAPAQDRLTMCRLAIEGDWLFETSDIELRMAGPSFTIETARELKRQGWTSVSWLIGGDTVKNLPTWHESGALLAEIEFVVMDRPGSPIDWNALPPMYQVLRSCAVMLPLIEISASDIRSRIRDERPVRYLTPDPVVKYIADNGLYR